MKINAGKILLIVLLLFVKNTMGQTLIKPKPKWVNLGITKLLWDTKYLIGVNYNFKPNQIIGFEIFQFGESDEGGIIFEDEIPNRIAESNTTKISYGYQIPIKNNNLKIIPSIGFGPTFGFYRTNDLAPSSSSGSSGGFNLSFGSVDYIEIPFSGISFTPQLDFIMHNTWGGFGIVLTNNNTFSDIGKTFSNNNIAFKVCLGRMR